MAEKSLVKVLHMTKLGAGGISTLTVNINKCLDLEKVRFDYLVFEDEKTFYEDIVKQYKARKRIVDVQKYKDNKITLYWKKYVGLKSLLRIEHYDIVHVDASTPLDVIIGLAAKHSRVNTIVLHSHIAGDLKKSKGRTIIMNICRTLMNKTFTDFFAISDESAKFMFPKSIYMKHNYTIYKNGIIADNYIPDIDVRRKIRKDLHIDNKLVLGHVGRFSNEKNHAFLVEVFAEILKKKPDAVLLLIGTGTLIDSIKMKCEKMGIIENVIFYGTSHEVPALLSVMDSFIFPSKFEGLGIAAIEAQCSGLPTFCSQGIPEEANVTDLFIRVDRFDAEEWADRILELDYNIERKDRVKKIREAGFDINTVAKDLEEFYINSCK